MIRILMLIVSMLAASCSQQKSTYKIDDLDSNGEINLQKWNYIIFHDDTLHKSPDKNKDYMKSIGLGSELDFASNPNSNGIFRINHFFSKVPHTDGFKSSKESIVGFEEISKSDLTGSIIYMYCNIISSKDQTGYMMSRSTDGLKLWVNGKEILHTAETRGFEQYFSDYVKINLHKGDNNILLKKVVNSTDLLIEVKLANYSSAVREYKKTSTGLILSNAIVLDTIKLRENQEKSLKEAVSYQFKNIQGNIVYTTTKTPNSSQNIITSSLTEGCAYMCSLTLGGQVISQPFFKGNPDKYYERINTNRYSFNDHVQQQIEPYMYRLDKLLKHDSRKSDWWWSFKVANLIYEIENCITKQKNKYHNDLTFGIQYRTYLSTLDSSMQDYLLITPDSLSSHEKVPLVLVLRPFIETQHPFLTSPQMSRYWGLLWAKNLSNKYRYTILMPSARLYQHEPMTPIAEADIFQAIEDVSKFYSIDKNRIYLHGNCSAGYRSLVLAEHHPHYFAAMGLYAPVTHLLNENSWIIKNSPQKNMNSYKTIPTILHYDPVDTHNPYSEFKDFIKDCHIKQIPLTISTKKYSGLHYNVHLVGEEAFDFFKDKKRSTEFKAAISRSENPERTINQPVILDFFGHPYLFVVNEKDLAKQGKTAYVARMIMKEYEKLLFARCPIKYDSEITTHDFETKNLFFIGHNFNNNLIKKSLKNISLSIKHDQVKINNTLYQGEGITFEAIFSSPINSKRNIIVYSTNSILKFEHKILSPWKSGFQRQIAIYDN
ncbi:hypothetical protein AY601_1112 [Pedobacter cryoconitis]|uniref:Peptidase S9 prolyl oligopeptidase catalytic domain-containing protein n=1 Tax=Pedobacter cryoconitis TaxID=188932 RepID=A0A127V9X1_9SPHI|nr:hypothetical protein [Pedobacter cryoconitis]AMP98039.1 hypothetical protein AY601_1112 [Pedobacter cryoconitis]